MSDQQAVNIVSAQLEAVVIRKDGTREDLGVVSYYHRNRIKNWWINAVKVWKGEDR